MLEIHSRQSTAARRARDAQLTNERNPPEDPIEIIPEVGTWLVKFGSDVLEGFESLSSAVAFALDVAKRSASAPRVLVRFRAASSFTRGSPGAS
jgi:hypothetical protein